MTRIDHTLPHTLPDRKPLLITLTCLVLWASAGWSQAASQGPRVILDDSRGDMVGTTLVIGRDLRGRVEGGAPDTLYQLTLLDETGAVVARQVVSSDADGNSDVVQVWDRSGITGCNAEFNPSAFPGSLAYNNVEEAGLDLDGRTFTLRASEVGAAEAFAWIDVHLQEPEQAIYYWSDAHGRAACRFERNDPVFLSVFKGHLEAWQVSRVFMLRSTKTTGT